MTALRVHTREAVGIRHPRPPFRSPIWVITIKKKSQKKKKRELNKNYSHMKAFVKQWPRGP